MAVLDEIRIYPVKSLPGVRIKSADVLQKGILHDRRYMLVDHEGRFLSQRSHPSMCRFEVALLDRHFNIRSKESDQSIILPLDPDASALRSTQATIWEDDVLVTEPFPDFSKWFSLQLGMDCRLVFFPESGGRPVDPDYIPTAGDWHVSLADGYPLLLTNQASLQDLNDRLSNPVSMERFRPNLMISGLRAYQEDTLKNFRIGSVTFAAVKPCARCNLITIDPQTGEAGEEPLRTLNTFRRKGNKVLFGMNTIPLVNGTIHEGDEIILI